MKCAGSVPGRILQLLQGLVVDGAHAVVDKGAAQEHSQGKDPRVILGIPLKSTLQCDVLHSQLHLTQSLRFEPNTYLLTSIFHPSVKNKEMCPQ